MIDSQEFPEKTIDDISASLGLNEGQRYSLRASVREALSVSAGTSLDVEVSVPDGILKVVFRGNEKEGVCKNENSTS